MDGISDHEEAKTSNENPKPLNHELKDVSMLFGSPRAGRGEVCLPTGTWPRNDSTLLGSILSYRIGVQAISVLT